MAGFAGARRLERAEERTLDLADLSFAVAGAAGHHFRAGLSAGAFAGRARGSFCQEDFALDAENGFRE